MQKNLCSFNIFRGLIGVKMKRNGLRKKELLSLGIVGLLLVTGCGTGDQESYSSKAAEAALIPREVDLTLAVEAPPFSDGIFPCSECHAYQETNPVKRVIDWHEDIQEIMDHDNENRWCLDCHDAESRDSLRLASGKTLDFKESYKLCGQCHGDRLRDWKAGVHGKRTGDWNGKKQYLLCVHCHNPHSPRFKEMKPEPPPLRQGERDTIPEQ